MSADDLLGQISSEFVPALIDEFERRDVGAESVVWAPHAAGPSVLDAISTVMLSVVDGTASISDLAREVHEEIGIPLDTAGLQVRRVVAQFAAAGILQGAEHPSDAKSAIAGREVFIAEPTPCSLSASQLGTVSINLRFGDQSLRVACDSRRAARRLRKALTDNICVDEQPLGFVLNAPQGFDRSHRLIDRAGIVLSSGRGLEAGLAALAAHLTAFTATPDGAVRIRARTLVGADRAIVLLPPLLYFTEIGTRQLVDAGLHYVNRLAIDVDSMSGQLIEGQHSWPGLPNPHQHTPLTDLPTTVIRATAHGEPTPSPAQFVSDLAWNAVSGTRAQVLDSCNRLAGRSVLVGTLPQDEALLATITASGAPNRESQHD